MNYLLRRVTRISSRHGSRANRTTSRVALLPIGDRNRETGADKRRLTRPRYTGSSTGIAAGRSELSTSPLISQLPLIARFETRSKIRVDSDGIAVDLEVLESSNSTRVPPRVAQRSAMETDPQFVRTGDDGLACHIRFGAETRPTGSNEPMSESVSALRDRSVNPDRPTALANLVIRAYPPLINRSTVTWSASTG
ncbi:hypothetical protein SAMN04488556_0300 [Halostagnicola kamekurae]|uniref:Uncharacterized protein n=1 Tax=Halostagnicola kamekurae TaxID=619731 RepID=A0A1I6P3N0_9EURY|nr:hypothetical protein SAMN04488556_0300 [Halostagnicola kamekurae]